MNKNWMDKKIYLVFRKKSRCHSSHVRSAEIDKFLKIVLSKKILSKNRFPSLFEGSETGDRTKKVGQIIDVHWKIINNKIISENSIIVYTLK